MTGCSRVRQNQSIDTGHKDTALTGKTRSHFIKPTFESSSNQRSHTALAQGGYEITGQVHGPASGMGSTRSGPCDVMAASCQQSRSRHAQRRTSNPCARLNRMTNLTMARLAMTSARAWQSMRSCVQGKINTCALKMEHNSGDLALSTIFPKNCD